MTSSAVAAYFGFDVERGAVGARCRRLVIRTVIVLLVIGGAAAGLETGRAVAASVHDGWSAPAGVVAGVAGALGSWLLASLLGLFVEIADALRVAR